MPRAFTSCSHLSPPARFGEGARCRTTGGAGAEVRGIDGNEATFPSRLAWGPHGMLRHCKERGEAVPPYGRPSIVTPLN